MDIYASNYITNWQVVIDHVLSRYPEEAGGVVLSDGTFHPVENTFSGDKTLGFEESSTQARPGGRLFYRNKRVRCVLHSHTYERGKKQEIDPRVPSKADLQSQIDHGVEFCIVTCDGVSVSRPFFWGDPDHRPPLRQREFIHSLQDCFEFVRDWYHQEFKLELPPFARHHDWWQRGENHMARHAKDWGFTDVTKLPVQRGDVILYQVDSAIINHLGVMEDEFTVSHHALGRFPRTEPYANQHKYAVQRVRHVTNPGATKRSAK